MSQLIESKVKLAYLAGFLDGEGHFYVPHTANGRGEHYFQFRIVAAQNTREVLDKIKEDFGGCVTTSHTKNKASSYQWVLCGKTAEKLADRLRPYLIVKQKQLKDAFDKIRNVG